LVVKIPRAKNMKLKSTVGMLEVRFFIGRTKLSCIKTELKYCTMTESLWNKYDFSRKSPEVPVKRSSKVVRKERALAMNAPWDSTAIG